MSGKSLRRVHFAGGGTGGHLFPALALAEALRARVPDCEIVFWGTKRGIEFRLRKRLGFPLRTVPIRGFNRRMDLGNLAIPFLLTWSILKVMGAFLRKRPDLVVGTGGYVSGPVGMAAALLRIPLVLHEQNSFPGATTRFLSRWAKRVYLTYEGSKRYFKNQEKLRVLGNPVRSMPALGRRSEALEAFGLAADRRTLLVFGGSQGAQAINERMVKIAKQLTESAPVQILWATGPAHLDKIAAELGEAQHVRLVPFIERMDLAYAAADLVLCRAGATTVAELAVAGKPAILIPLPTAAAGHQELNARELEREGAAICLLQHEATPEQLQETITSLLQDEQALARMANNMKRLAKPNAAADIVSDICDTLLTDC